MRLIPLTKGYSAMVDDADFEWLSQWRWYAAVNRRVVYAARVVKLENGKRKTLPMHRAILQPTDGKVHIDHKDRNGLNNQRQNIRLCTNEENLMNRGGNSNTTSRFKGVSWDNRLKKWRVSIRANAKDRYLGMFENEVSAAIAYDEAASNLFGKFSFLNFPDRIAVNEPNGPAFKAALEKIWAEGGEEIEKEFKPSDGAWVGVDDDYINTVLDAFSKVEDETKI